MGVGDQINLIKLILFQHIGDEYTTMLVVDI